MVRIIDALPAKGRKKKTGDKSLRVHPTVIELVKAAIENPGSIAVVDSSEVPKSYGKAPSGPVNRVAKILGMPEGYRMRTYRMSGGAEIGVAMVVTKTVEKQIIENIKAENEQARALEREVFA